MTFIYNHLLCKDKDGRRDWTRTNDPHHVNVRASAGQAIDLKVKTRLFALIKKHNFSHYTSMTYICILTTFFAPMATAATLSLEFGQSSRLMARQAVNSHTREPAPSVSYKGLGIASDGKWFGEVYSGAWDGHRIGRVTAVSAGYQTLNPFFVRASIGAARISDTNYQLSTHNQILTSIMIGYRSSVGFDLHLGYRHISNASGLIKGSGSPNLGEDFLVGGIGVNF